MVDTRYQRTCRRRDTEEERSHADTEEEWTYQWTCRRIVREREREWQTCRQRVSERMRSRKSETEGEERVDGEAFLEELIVKRH